MFFVPLSLAMLNDDSAACKKMVALAIKSLLNQLDLQHQNSMFNLVNTWLTGEKVSRKTKRWKRSAEMCFGPNGLRLWAFVAGSAATRSSGLWAVCGGRRGKVQPETGRPDTSHRERDPHFQL